MKNTPNIVIDGAKINELPKGSLPAYLVEESKPKDYNNKAKEPVIETTTYVSSSPDFDPSLKEKNKNNFRNNKNNKDKKHAKRRENNR